MTIIFAVIFTVPCLADDLSLGCVVVDAHDVPVFAGVKLKKDGVFVVGVMSGGPVSEELKVGDLITAVAGKPVKDPEALETVLSDVTPGKAVKIAYQRFNSKAWKSSTATVKPVELHTALMNAMAFNTDAVTKLTTYDFRRPVNELLGEVPMHEYVKKTTNVGMRVLESDGKFYLALSFGYRANEWLFVKTITFASEGQPFELELEFDDVKRDSSNRTYYEWATIPLKPAQIDQLKKALTPFQTVRLSGSSYKFDYELAGEDWASIQTAIAFYEQKVAKQ